jgi:hypothetical protein
MKMITAQKSFPKPTFGMVMYWNVLNMQKAMKSLNLSTIKTIRLLQSMLLATMKLFILPKFPIKMDCMIIFLFTFKNRNLISFSALPTAKRKLRP